MRPNNRLNSKIVSGVQIQTKYLSFRLSVATQFQANKQIFEILILKKILTTKLILSEH